MSFLPDDFLVKVPPPKLPELLEGDWGIDTLEGLERHCGFRLHAGDRELRQEFRDNYETEKAVLARRTIFFHNPPRGLTGERSRLYVKLSQVLQRAEDGVIPGAEEDARKAREWLGWYLAETLMKRESGHEKGDLVAVLTCLGKAAERQNKEQPNYLLLPYFVEFMRRKKCLPKLTTDLVDFVYGELKERLNTTDRGGIITQLERWGFAPMRFGDDKNFSP